MHHYDHQKIEKKWQEYWEKNQTFAIDTSKKRPHKYYALDMFPYPSSAGLHVGHPEGYTATDIAARYRRMRYGENVLHPMGFDAFGLPAENYAIKVGGHPRQITDENIKNFTRQLKSLGFSYDWSRQVNTSESAYYKWTQWMFCQLYKHGLAYKKKAPVNWCESCKTVLAREQVVDGKCERCKNQVIQKELEQWFFKVTAYAEELLSSLDQLDWPEPIKALQRNWIGRSEGAMIKFPLADFPANESKKPKSKFNEILLATTNPAKQKRVRALLQTAGLNIKVLSLKDLNIVPIDIDENGDLSDNARTKALSYRDKTGLPILSIDTGFFIEGEKIDPTRVKRNALCGKNEKQLKQSDIAALSIDYYKNIAAKKGGQINAFWKDMFALSLPGGQLEYGESIREVVLTDQIKGEVDINVPLRCMYRVQATGKYVTEQSEQETLVELRPYYDALLELLTENYGQNDEDYLEVFTTRPDTIFGATYMVVAPEHELIANCELRIANFKEVEQYIDEARKKNELERTDLAKEKTGVEIKGIKAINPATNEAIPIFVADYVLMGYGTGAIMAVPAHDERDFEFAKKYHLNIKKVVIPPKLQSTPINVPYLKNEPIQIVPPECYVSDGIAINSGKFNGLTTAEFKQKITAWLEEKGLGKKAVNYKLRDWLVSRQRYWGAPIPIIYCRQCLETQNSKLKTQNCIIIHGSNRTEEVDDNFQVSDVSSQISKEILVPESDLPVLLPDDVDFRPTGESPLARSKEFNRNLKCPVCGTTEGVKREVDTMDTFVCSSWYFLRYTDPHNPDKPFDADKVKYWLPVDLYVGGAEHAVLHLMYARFFTKALADMGYLHFREPFLKLRNQGMILAEDGRKMSKSLGNVINPDEVVARYGADTLRLYEMFMGPLEDTKPWSTKSIIGVRRFLEKIWKLANELDSVEKFDKEKNISLHKTIKKITEDVENMKFNTAIAQMMIFVNEFSSIEYLVSLKKEITNRNGFIKKYGMEHEYFGNGNYFWVFRDEEILVEAIEQYSNQKEIKNNILSTKDTDPLGWYDTKKKEEIKKETKIAFEKFLILLSPFAPHLAEELWRQLGHNQSIISEPWPTYDPKLIKLDKIEIVVQINGKVRGKIFTITDEATEEEVVKDALALDSIKKWLNGQMPKKIIYIPGRLLNLVV